jgi:N-ethylmaleimide reductase
MTRSRAEDRDVPTTHAIEYYRQRATAGLIVTEGTQPSLHGKGYCRTPGIYSAEQIVTWRTVTDAVHAQCCPIVMQLMHCGRIGTRFNKEPGAETVAPSAIKAGGKIFSDSNGMVEHDTPRALATAEIPMIIGEFRDATRNALAAGFDGVELHAASGYLPMQFLSTGTNRRTDAYGGSTMNRIRFVVETLEAMCEVAGPGRVGIRICPGNPFNDITDDDPAATYRALLRAIDPMRLAYLHLILLKTHRIDGLEVSMENFTGPMILNDSVTLDRGNELVDSGTAAAVSFARSFIANPDLVRRLREGAELAFFDRKTLYTPGPAGYVDYPFLNQ